MTQNSGVKFHPVWLGRRFFFRLVDRRYQKPCHNKLNCSWLFFYEVLFRHKSRTSYPTLHKIQLRCACVVSEIRREKNSMKIENHIHVLLMSDCVLETFPFFVINYACTCSAVLIALAILCWMLCYCCNSLICRKWDCWRWSMVYFRLRSHWIFSTTMPILFIEL